MRGFRALSYNAKRPEKRRADGSGVPQCAKGHPGDRNTCLAGAGDVHAGMKYVVNAIPDNWPMALHLSEGSVHTIQCHNSYMGYRILNGMNKDKVNKPMPSDSLVYTGHYIDHELVQGIERTVRRVSGEKRTASRCVSF